MKPGYDKIDFRVTVEEKRIIEKNADRYSMPTGTYLRALGLAGIAPFTTREVHQAGIVTAAGVEFTPKSQRAKAS